MTINAGICLLLLIMIISSAYQGYKKGLFNCFRPLISFFLPLSVLNLKLFPGFKTVIKSYYGDNYFFPWKILKYDMLENIDDIFTGNTFLTQKLLIFLLSYFVISSIITMMTRNLNSSVTGTLFKVLGAIVNSCFCIIRIWIIMLIISCLATLLPPMAEWQEVLFSSQFYKAIYLLNPLL